MTFESAPPVDVQSDDFKKNDTLAFPSSGYRLDYAPTSAELATVTIGGGYAKTQTVCRLAPAATGFTIQQSIFDAMRAGLDPSDAVILATVTFYARVVHLYKHDGKLRRAISVHRRMKQLAFKPD